MNVGRVDIKNTYLIEHESYQSEWTALKQECWNWVLEALSEPDFNPSLYLGEVQSGPTIVALLAKSVGMGKP